MQDAQCPILWSRVVPIRSMLTGLACYKPHLLLAGALDAAVSKNSHAVTFNSEYTSELPKAERPQLPFAAPSCWNFAHCYGPRGLATRKYLEDDHQLSYF